MSAVGEATRTTKKTWLPYGKLLAAYWLVLLALLHWPRVPAGHGRFGVDKLVHATLYGAFAALVVLSAAAYLRRRELAFSRIALTLVALTVVAAQGIFDELTQPYTGRTCDLYDWVADMLGASIALLIWNLCTWLWAKPRPLAGAAKHGDQAADLVDSGPAPGNEQARER